MRNHPRARSLALTALCAGTTLGAGLAVVPGNALAKTKPVTVACSNVYGSGSTLQTPFQDALIPVAVTDKAFANCTTTPTINYNTDSAGNELLPSTGTGSTAAQKQFAAYVTSPVETSVNTAWSATGEAAATGNGSAYLDGFDASDVAPSSAGLPQAAGITGSSLEVVPVAQAPVAIALHLPAGCTITKSPLLTNTDLSAALDDQSNWTTLLTDAGAAPKGCPTTTPVVQVRSDGSGTTAATKNYLGDINSGVWSGSQGTGASWPQGIDASGDASTTQANTAYTSGGTVLADSGSGGEANSVVATAGSIGYVNAADAVNAGINAWKKGATTFFVALQNNGTGSSVTAAAPLTSKGIANCKGTYTGSIPSGNSPDWSGTWVGNPSIGSNKTFYPLCTLTYDFAWQSYQNASGGTEPTALQSYYTDPANGGIGYTGESPAGVENTVRDYLTWLVGSAKKQGQTSIPAGYAALPSNIDAAAQSEVASYVGTN